MVSISTKPKSEWLAPGFLAAAVAIGGAYLYSEIQKSKFPSIAIAFNKDGESFVTKNPSPNKARNQAQSLCNKESAWFSSCEVKVFTTSGSPLCVTYGSLPLAFYNFSPGRTSAKTNTTYSFASVTASQPTYESNPTVDQCLRQMRVSDLPANFCRAEKFTTTCNHN